MPEAWGGSALPLPDQVRIVESLALDRLVRDAITINQHVAAGPLMLDAAGRLALGLELQGFVAAIADTTAGLRSRLPSAAARCLGSR